MNVHASLLPKYRGGAPIHYALINGDEEAGVTIMEMVKEMDAGDMIAARSLPILDEDNVGTLFEKLAVLGRDLLPRYFASLPGRGDQAKSTRSKFGHIFTEYFTGRRGFELDQNQSPSL